MRNVVVRALAVTLGAICPGVVLHAQAYSLPPTSADLARPDSAAARAHGWLPRIVLGAGAGLDPRESMPSDVAVLAGLELAHSEYGAQRIRLRVEYLANYRGDGTVGSSLACRGCSSLLQGGSLALMLVPFPEARLQPYALAGLGWFHSRNRFADGLRTADVESGFIFGAGLTARLTARADAFVELRSVGVGGGLLPVTGGVRWRF